MNMDGNEVSTHSRPKAAGLKYGGFSFGERFNTQPPEGGWKRRQRRENRLCCFNTQPPEGGWENE